MKTEFLKRFFKDLEKISDQNVLNEIRQVVNEVETATHFSGIKNLRKLKGYRNTYRIRLGDYRIGVYIENDTVEFARFVHRKDIYRIFP